MSAGGAGVLARIVASKREEIRRARAAEIPRIEGLDGRAPLDARAALARPEGHARDPRAPLRLVAEVKLRSPSAGALSRALGPAARALAYARGGASMVSVLCDAPFFDGGFAHLADARAALDRAKLRVPLLAKEFVLDEVQLDLARAHGADAVLLIARIVSAAELARLADAARARGLEPLVEVVDEAELDAALAAGARVVGVNARDLDTLAMDAARTARVLARVPRDVVAVHLSGLKAPADVRAVAQSRADAALIGEALMRTDDPAPLLAELVAAARA